VVGVVGPRGDGYRSDGAPRPAEAADHHRAQVAVFAEAGVEVVTAYTLTTAGEAIGIAQSCREQGLPVAISFTVEVDGRLPDGTTLTETITEVDDREAPDYYLVNCATRITCSRG
jgi:homocysteine S-methyltransferase